MSYQLYTYCLSCRVIIHSELCRDRLCGKCKRKCKYCKGVFYGRYICQLCYGMNLCASCADNCYCSHHDILPEPSISICTKCGMDEIVYENGLCYLCAADVPFNIDGLRAIYIILRRDIKLPHPLIYMIIAHM